MPRAVFGLAALLAAAAAPVGAVTIAEIVADGEGFNGREVTVVGTVVDPKAGHAGETVYTLSANDRRITVFGRSTVPGAGERIEVTATVRWKEGDEEFTWPPVLFESARRPAP